MALAFRQVGDDQANGGRAFGPEQDGRHQGRHLRGVGSREGQFRSPLALAEHRGQQPAVGRGNEVLHPAAHDPFQRHLEHLGEAMVAVMNDALGSERGRTFAHLFDQGPIGVLAALEREQALALGRGDDQGIHLAFADGT